ncbi:nuclease-related domain-containing protein [Metamycoplasma hyosynoviae]|uniref:nuclease-related domain-containing protein n=1 Tax=Metamycoplasma hyosynoviae TaxID=29559 RepID=UPI00235A3865|nr:nuclease-related domain-containing protein [Metamycoplasma hyosynoviae]MDC8915491.1 nuclease-related domain-containing protein [Metamycoplasma hyosynoviae]
MLKFYIHMPLNLIIILISIILGVLIISLIVFLVKRKRKKDIAPYISENNRAGIKGEQIVNYYLSKLIKKDEFLLTNLLLPLKNGYTTEIDCVLISHKGIFCIEIKNWIGHISGNDESEYWIQKYRGPHMRDKNHPNPVKQNEEHCEILERRIHNNYQVDNVVIFPKLEVNGIESDFTYTIKNFLNYYQKLNDDQLNSSEIKILYQALLPFAGTKEELKTHSENTIRRFNK